MRADLSDRTYDILLHGLTLRDKVRAGGSLTLGSEQAKFKSLLGPANSAAPWGSANDPTRSIMSDHGGEFLGMRYALACWLDEILIDAGWREWDENKLESALYRTNVRYRNFWQQAKLAEAIPDAADAQEAFLLCALLGFHGEKGEDPAALREWVSSTRSRVTRSMGKEPPPLPERAPITDVPPLTGAEAYRKMTMRLVIGVMLVLPVAVFLLAWLFR